MHAPHEIARADAIRWVRIKMAQSGLTLADLLAAGCFAPTAARPRYRKMPRGKPGMGEGSVPTGFSGPSTPDSSRNSFRSTEESAPNAPGSMTRGALARGRFAATVVQQCVVTLEPVTNRVEGEIAQRFAPDVEPDTAEIAFDALAEEPPEPLSGGAAELGELVVEHLALALDPYPRAPGAQAALPGEDGEGAATPFAKLRDIKFSATED